MNQNYYKYFNKYEYLKLYKEKNKKLRKLMLIQKIIV